MRSNTTNTKDDYITFIYFILPFFTEELDVSDKLFADYSLVFILVLLFIKIIYIFNFFRLCFVSFIFAAALVIHNLAKLISSCYAYTTAS